MDLDWWDKESGSGAARQGIFNAGNPRRPRSTMIELAWRPGWSGRLFLDPAVCSLADKVNKAWREGTMALELEAAVMRVPHSHGSGHAAGLR